MRLAEVITGTVAHPLIPGQTRPRPAPGYAPEGSIVEVIGLGPPIEVEAGNIGMTEGAQLCRLADNRCVPIPDACLKPHGKPPPIAAMLNPWERHEGHAHALYTRALPDFFKRRAGEGGKHRQGPGEPR